MKEKIICAGFGGQGIIILGKLLAYSGMLENFNVSWMPSYGAEVRGGTAHSMIVISDKEITSPKVAQPTAGIIMNNPSFDKFESKIKKDGLMIINSSIIHKNITRSDINVLDIPATQSATDLGHIKVSNMIMAGAFIRSSRLLKKETLLKSLKYVLPKRYFHLIPFNEKAIEKGFNLADKLIVA